jgi:hypothetical protein
MENFIRKRQLLINYKKMLIIKKLKQRQENERREKERREKERQENERRENERQENERQENERQEIYEYMNANFNRVNFYLGNDFAQENFTIDTPLHNIINIGNNSAYDEPFKKLLIETGNQDKEFDYCEGDVQHETNKITFCKNRCDGNKNGVILRCLDFSRHWDCYYNKPKDIQFNKKINKIFWRGATTNQPSKPANRFDLVEKWFNKNQNIDVGFSVICQGKENYSIYVKGQCGIDDFLKHKYIISVEGNDKDSGLQWKLNSNSVVLMPKPRVTSWLMETTLIPDYHYVLLKDDFSDLEEKLNWCNNNQTKCIEIIKNAQRFMGFFSNGNKERELEKEVINKYFALMNSR